MNPAAWIALASLGAVVLVQTGTGLYHMGRQSARIAALEDKTKDVGSLAVLAAAMAELKAQLGIVQGDVKKLLGDRSSPSRRRGVATD